MAIMIGSARSDERGKYSGGAAGDQKQTSSSNDTKGEVSIQQMYTHSKGWNVLRAKSTTHANKIAERMRAACNNKNIGYDQGGRYGVINNGINTKVKTEADCSSLVRQCVKEATGKDAGDFTTGNAVSRLEATGLFNKRFAYVSQAKTPIYDGDILCTKTKGHIVVVVSGNSRKATSTTTSPVNGNPYSEPTLLICTSNIIKTKKYSSRQATSKGNGVRWVQFELNQSGCKDKDGKSLIVDGDCETNTDFAIRQFQKLYKLTVDGIVGSNTRAALKRV